VRAGINADPKVSSLIKGQIKMNLANTITELEQQASNQQEKGVVRDHESTIVNTPRQVLQSALDALREGNIPEVLEQFANNFMFDDHTLTLEFTDKLRLREFLEKSRELFPDTALDLLSLFEDGDHAIGQWKLSAAQTVPYGSTSYRFPIFLFGATIVRVENGKIVQWSDYHDQSSSRRMSLPAFFTKGI
jgi:ketosteroid isomerase-like protein